MLACRLIWPYVDVTVAQLVGWWLAVLIVGLLGIAMVGVDCYGAWQGETWYRGQVEKQLDWAEHWLASWTAPVVRVGTLGIINPRRSVGIEVRKALVEAARQLNCSLWWGSLPIGLRIAFGGSLWLTYVWQHS